MGALRAVSRPTMAADEVMRMGGRGKESVRDPSTRHTQAAVTVLSAVHILRYAYTR